MRSSSGEYYERLDHLRALAVFLVFCWHFLHERAVPFDYVPAFPPLSILDESHTGVALFMTLSGYLFAKLIDGRAVSFRAFLWNRIVRLAPLLTVVLLSVAAYKVAVGAMPAEEAGFRLISGFLLPVWGNGAWSITAEIHFYLVMPLIIVAAARDVRLVLWLVLIAITVRAGIYMSEGTVRQLAYFTIAGRFDQFALGICAWTFFRGAKPHNWLMAAAFVAFVAFMHSVNVAGGIDGTLHSPVWIVFTTIEGLFYALLIAWYDGGTRQLPAAISGLIAKVGQASYSIYLLHFIVVFAAARWLDDVTDMRGMLPGLLLSVVAFAAFCPIAWLSYRLIEQPFFRYRRRYLRPGEYPLQTARSSG